MTLFDQYIIKQIDAKSRGQEAEADSFNFSEAEKALDLRVMAFDFENHGLSERLSESVYALATLGCSDCKTLCFPEEVATFGGIDFHIGCGGRVKELPF